jgi:hypothetical protein
MTAELGEEELKVVGDEPPRPLPDVLLDALRKGEVVRGRERVQELVGDLRREGAEVGEQVEIVDGVAEKPMRRVTVSSPMDPASSQRMRRLPIRSWRNQLRKVRARVPVGSCRMRERTKMGNPGRKSRLLLLVCLWRC